MAAREPASPDPYQCPIRPMLAAAGPAPAGTAWGFEFDWEGLRAVAYLDRDRLRLVSGSSGRPITSGYPELTALTALAGSRGELVLDGKIVATDGRERPAVGLLRARMGTTRPSPTLLRRAPVRFYLTDVLHRDGRSTLGLPYRRRRELLAELDLTGLPARLSTCFLDTDGDTLLEVARLHQVPGLTAVLAKRLDSRYQPGRRSRAWTRTPLRPRAPAPSRGIQTEPDAQPAPAAQAADLAELEEAVRLAQAEVRTLRAQISPHFVYNALTTIATFVRTDPTRARELLGQFADYTRYSFRAGASTTTLGAELANVERYLMVEQARFEDRLRVNRRVCDGLEDVALPFLTLQPLVEHVVRHGIEGTARGGTVDIAATADGPDCVISVSADASVEPDRLAELAADLRARLAGAGDPDALEVRVGRGGTTVTVRVPR